MARDIEEFLRRAAERRQAQKAQGQQPPRRNREPEDELIVPEVVHPEPPRRRRAAEPSVQPVRQRLSKPDIRKGSLSDHVETHLDTSSLSQHAERLGDRISRVHDQVDSRIHQHLDHNVSKIDDRPTITDDPRPQVQGADISPIADDLLKILSKPQSIRQAILLNEILRRPVWDDEDIDD